MWRLLTLLAYKLIKRDTLSLLILTKSETFSANSAEVMLRENFQPDKYLQFPLEWYLITCDYRFHSFSLVCLIVCSHLTRCLLDDKYKYRKHNECWVRLTLNSTVLSRSITLCLTFCHARCDTENHFHSPILFSLLSSVAGVGENYNNIVVWQKHKENIACSENEQK